MSDSAWGMCMSFLQNELPAQQFNTWIRPLRVEEEIENVLRLVAPNRFVSDWVTDKYKNRIQDILNESDQVAGMQVEIVVSSNRRAAFELKARNRELGIHQRRNAQNVQPEVSQAPAPAAAVNTNAPVDFFSDEAPASAPVAVAQGQPAEQQAEQTHLDLQGLNNKPFSPQEHTQAAIQPMANMALVDNSLQQSSLALGGQQPGAHSDAAAGNPSPIGQPFNGLIEPPSVKDVIDNRQMNKPMRVDGGLDHKSNLNTNFTFENFVVGKSNQLGLAAASQVAENPGGSYNPLFIYGGVGLGKTHLMHAVGNALCERKPGSKVVYLHSERFVADMVKALQLNAINDFKRYYRSVDALLIDDIQFFAGKDRSQEEFFHTFNALLEGGHQIIVTCDRYPKEIEGLEERLKSRFGWGLTVAIEPPELETRVAILKRKADSVGMHLPNDAAFFIAQRIRSNVRELEGTLKRVIANAHFTGREISVELVRESLKDLLALQDRLVSIDNIQRIVAEYYKIKVSDLLSKRRSRSVARPRQAAMYLAKDLTNHSLPEIGDAFGGRDHTTVLHACRKINELLETDADIKEDIKNLLRTLTT